jgi:hypothetical protein
MEEMKNRWVPVTDGYKAQLENPTPAAAPGVPQFSTAEYSSSAVAAPCKMCGETITGAFYRVNGNRVCGKCATTLKERSDSHAAFVSAILFGLGGAVIGLILYSGFVFVTGISIGYLALAVGWIVAKAMLMGSKGIGGPRYQIVAVVLTYFAISLSSIAILFGYVLMHPDAASLPDLSVPRLLMLGLASPILRVMNSPTHILGLVILFVGLSIAFRMTKSRAIRIEGPLNA